MSDLIELGKRAAACKHWKWMPGMVDIHGSRFLNPDVGGGRWWIAWGEDGTCLDEARDDDTPDLSDPATVGCLLHLVRMACGNMQVCSNNENHLNWGVSVDAGFDSIVLSEDCESEVEALVAALEVDDQ